MFTHSDRLERWLGSEAVASLTRAMRDFYWPIPVQGVPGIVHAMPGGDFTGEIRGGSEVSAMERAQDSLRRFKRRQRARVAHSKFQLGAFANLQALLNAQAGGKQQVFPMAKTSAAVAAIGNCDDLWTIAGTPVAGAAGAAAPTGTSPTNTTTGALTYINPSTANSGHFVSGYVTSTQAGNTLLLYDRLFSVAKTMNSTTTESVTGTFSRYQSTSALANNFAGGNFCFPSNPTTVLAATAHNWTVCQYTNQAGTASQSFPSATGLSACAVHSIDLVVGTWFMPLSAGDSGVQALTQMQCSAAVATGTIDFVVGHPLAFFPCPIISLVCVVDGINSAMNLSSVFDNACLGFIEMPKPTTNASVYTGQVICVSE